MPIGDQADLGAWAAVHPSAAAAWFSALAVPWWIAGGWALDLFLGRESRAHGDLDVGFLRRDVGAVRAALPSWAMFEAKDGVLTRLRAGDAPRSNVHSLWCRPADATPEIQLLYKARRVRPRDQIDFELFAPLLDAAARAWLLDALQRAEPGHSWISALR